MILENMHSARFIGQNPDK